MKERPRDPRSALASYGRQQITEADIAAVEQVLRSDYLTQGQAVPTFEQGLCRLTGAAHAVAVNSATSALHLGCRALGLGPGDRLWTVPNTFVASASCGHHCGAEVSFVDIHPDTGNLCPERLASRLEAAERAGALPKVLVPVDFAGQPCDLEALARLKARYGFSILEDASHAVGATFGDRPIGAGDPVDITVFSFHPVKIVTTAEGGAALCNDSGLGERLRLLRTHGITRDPARLREPSPGPWAYEQQELGFNFRMTDLQAALGVSQLERLPAFLRRRRALADAYDEALAGLPLRPLRREPGRESAWHLYVVRLDDPKRRGPVFEGLRARGLGVQVHYIPVHTQPYWQALGHRWGDHPQAEAYYRSALTLPLHPGLEVGDLRRVRDALAEALAEA